MIFGVQPELLTWVVARAAGLTSYGALCIAILSGIALRTSILDFLATNRALRSLHEFMTWIWIPLGAAHAIALVIDRTARIEPLHLFVPFTTDYGRLAIGLGAISLDLVVLVVVSGWLRERMDLRQWRLLHRLSYPAFVVLFLHAVLSGTDFDSPLVSAISWSAGAGVALLAASRVVFGRLPS